MFNFIGKTSLFCQKKHAKYHFEIYIGANIIAKMVFRDENHTLGVVL